MSLAILFLFVHFVADFVLQTDRMAMNKSTSWAWLSSHVAVYTLTVFLVSLVCFGFEAASWFALANGSAHFATDAVTSRVTSALWKRGDRHNFFVVIGFDQFLHTAVLLLLLERLPR